MRISTDSEAIAHFVDQVAALDDAPDRARHEWFYADLARLTVEAVDDLAQEIADGQADAEHDAYTRGYDAGRRGAHQLPAPGDFGETGRYRTHRHTPRSASGKGGGA